MQHACEHAFKGDKCVGKAINDGTNNNDDDNEKNKQQQQQQRKRLFFHPPTTWLTKSPTSPVLKSFSGNPTSPSPKSYVYRLLGYGAPFDRHDWVVVRCRDLRFHEGMLLRLTGEYDGDLKVREETKFVIDFYNDGGTGRGIWVDVRPCVRQKGGAWDRGVRWVGF